MKIITTLKNGFGNQVSHLSYALHLSQQVKSELYIFKNFAHIHENGFTYTSILSNYLNISIGRYERFDDMQELLCIRFIENDYINRNNILSNNHNLDIICTDYPNILYKLYPNYFKDFSIVKMLMILSRYCSLDRNIESVYTTDTNDRIGFYFRFFPTNLNYLKDKHIENKIKIPFSPISHLNDSIIKLQSMKNEKLFIASDCYELFNKYNFFKYIDTSNDVTYEIENTPSNVDICDMYKNSEDYDIMQYNSLKIACRLAKCKKFFGSKYSSFSELFIPFLRIKLS